MSSTHDTNPAHGRAPSAEHAEIGGYPIGMVATLAGLSVDTIRAWERRYGLPHPARSEGGHRLYSPRDVALLRRAVTLRATGLTAASACAQALADAVSPPASGTAGSPVTARLGARLYDAALALDAGRVAATLGEASALLDLETLWRDVIAPTLSRLGENWAHGTATAAPEHLLSGLVRTRLAAIMEAQPRLPGAPSAVVGAAPNEQHDLAALMLALMLAHAGWHVTFLGAATPPEALEAAVRAVRPRVAVVAATLPEHATAALAALRQARDRLGRQAPVLAYGGPAFATMAPRDSTSDEEDLLLLPDEVPAAARRVAALA